MERDTYQSLLKDYGKPLYVAKPDIKDSHMDTPAEIMVFKLDEDLGGVICFSRYTDKSEWHANDGERFVISDLLENRITFKTMGPKQMILLFAVVFLSAAGLVSLLQAIFKF